MERLERIISTRRLVEWMDRRGLSTRELALVVGCSRSGIGHLRSGRSQKARPARARRIEAGLGLPVGWLFTVDGQVTTDHDDNGMPNGGTNGGTRTDRPDH